MSFEQFAEKIASHPEVTAQTVERSREAARKAWHELWLSTIYPHWQGPLVAMSRKAGIESARHMVVPNAPAFELPEETARLAGLIDRTPPRVYVVSELVMVSSVVQVGVSISYSFAGDEHDGAILRLVTISDTGLPIVLPQHAKVWTGPQDKLVDALVADVADASALCGPLILEAYNAKVARLEREKAEREEAERKAAAERTAAAEAAERERVTKETAALAESQRLEAEAAAVKEE